MSVVDFSSLLEFLPEDLEDVVPFPYHRRPRQPPPPAAAEPSPAFASLETPVHQPDYGRGFPASPMPPTLMFDPPEYVFDREPPNYAASLPIHHQHQQHQQQQQQRPRPTTPPLPPPPLPKPTFHHQPRQQQKKKQLPPLPPPPLPKPTFHHRPRQQQQKQPPPAPVSPQRPPRVSGLSTNTRGRKITKPPAVVFAESPDEKKKQQQQPQKKKKRSVPKNPTFLAEFKIPKKMSTIKEKTVSRVSKSMKYHPGDVLILHPDPDDFKYVLGHVPPSYQQLFKNLTL